MGPFVGSACCFAVYPSMGPFVGSACCFAVLQAGSGDPEKFVSGPLGRRLQVRKTFPVDTIQICFGNSIHEMSRVDIYDFFFSFDRKCSLFLFVL